MNINLEDHIAFYAWANGWTRAQYLTAIGCVNHMRLELIGG